ncbi:MAG: hypothetical protein IJV54_12320 [Bacteroidales bacterium]|nr:hypothetical protein [Bacteroidales bacterium]
MKESVATGAVVLGRLMMAGAEIRRRKRPGRKSWRFIGGYLVGILGALGFLL